MEETLHQPPMLARPPQGRRFPLGAARIALLLVLPAAGLGVVVWTAVQNGPLTGTRGEAARPAREYVPRDQAASPSGSLQEILAHPDRIPSHDHPLVGRQAPDFELADAEGKAWDLRQLRAGGSLVLIFFYGYHCPNCVRQLFDVHRDLPLFRAVGAQVVAISADPPELTRRQFQQDGPFGFPVLSDPGDKLRQAYQVLRRTRDGKRTDLLRHGTFVLDRHGAVQWVNVGDAPFRRNPALLSYLAQMEGRLPSP